MIYLEEFYIKILYKITSLLIYEKGTLLISIFKVQVQQNLIIQFQSNSVKEIYFKIY